VSSGQLTGRAAVENGSDSERLLLEILEGYEQEYTGSGDTLDDALKNAYKNAEASGKHVFHVNHIFIRGDNPLSGYGVVISPHG
jgi:hypothetical protein